jgi:hypothetical protein
MVLQCSRIFSIFISLSKSVVLRLDRSIQLRTNRYKEIRKAEGSGYRGQAAVRRD